MGKGWAGTRAEREWLATLRRIARALERIAGALEIAESDEGCTGEGSQIHFP